MDDRGNVPHWEVDAEFPRDVFTFGRLKWRSKTGRRSMTWETDFPDSDLNMSWRLHQLTSMRVHPEGAVVDIMDPKLCEYPFYFLSGAGGFMVNEEEATILRKYLLGGGFIFVDDFWGPNEWDTFEEAMEEILPNRKWEELELSHQVFHIVFDLKQKPQIPNIYVGSQNRGTGITWERPDAKEPHYRAYYDDRGRMMMFISHNSDMGDGWEEEASDPWYFQTYSEPKAYPLGLNVLFYALTH